MCCFCLRLTPVGLAASERNITRKRAHTHSHAIGGLSKRSISEEVRVCANLTAATRSRGRRARRSLACVRACVRLFSRHVAGHEQICACASAVDQYVCGACMCVSEREEERVAH